MSDAFHLCGLSYKKTRLKICKFTGRLADSVERVTLDLRILSSSPMLDVRLTLKQKNPYVHVN